MILYFPAGRDTTAQLLSWMFYRISQNPSVESKLVAEIDSILSGQKPTYETTNQLDYAHAVCQETLRLHPSVPRELKHAIDACILPDGTHIPAGSAVVPAIQVMGTQEKVRRCMSFHVTPPSRLMTSCYHVVIISSHIIH